MNDLPIRPVRKDKNGIKSQPIPEAPDVPEDNVKIEAQKETKAKSFANKSKLVSFATAAGKAFDMALGNDARHPEKMRPENTQEASISTTKRATQQEHRNKHKVLQQAYF